MTIGAFSGDWDELAQLIQVEWGTHFGDKTHFNYPSVWLQSFFTDPELAIEYRNAAGELTGFIGAVPRRYMIHGRDIQLGLVTLLTSARRNTVGVVGLDLERELFLRARARGLFGTYHFCLDGQRTPDLLRFAAATIKTRAVEVEPVTSLIGQAKAYPPEEGAIRPITAADAEWAAALIETVGGHLAIHRRVTASELARGLDDQPPKRWLALLRDGKPIGLTAYARRKLLGRDITEVANLDLLIAPDVKPDEAKRYGRAIATDAAAHGAAFLIAPQRAPVIFPHARDAGLRLSPRTLRVLIVPSLPENVVEKGSAHLLEVE